MSPTAAQLNEEHLIGTWRLRACEGRADDGAVMLPYTDKPEGMLVYNTDGKMTVILMKPDRPLFESNDLMKGSDEEIRVALEGFNFR